MLAQEFANRVRSLLDTSQHQTTQALSEGASRHVVPICGSECAEDGGHMELQILRYAAMVSAMTFDAAVEAYVQMNYCSGITPRSLRQ